jgi:hypothetical protein
MYVHGFDKFGRPVVYTKKKPHPASPEMASMGSLDVSFSLVADTDRGLAKLSLYTMEKALRMMKQTGAAQVVWVVDLEGPRSNTQNLGYLSFIYFLLWLCAQQTRAEANCEKY